MEMTSRKPRLQIGLIALAILIELPFLNQPFHMDDTVYLHVADNIRVSPLFPQDAPNDPTRAAGDLLVRDDVFVKPAPWLRFAAGASEECDQKEESAAAIAHGGRW